MKFRTRPIRRALVSAAAGLLVLCCGLIAGAAERVEPAVNPHWNAKGCTECHAAPGGAPRTIPGSEVDRLCVRCHNGRAAPAESHPVARAVTKETPAPAAWPVVDGRLGCVTCHDVKAACDANARRPEVNARMLRAPTGPRGSSTFCQNCHRPEDFARSNPHVMLTPERAVVAEKCLECHSRVPDRTAKARTGNAQLRGDGVALCLSCHSKHREEFNPGHLGSQIKPEMQAFIRAREIIGLSARPGPELLAQLKAAEAKPTQMPTSADGAITCSTCHNPHQAGVFAPGTPLAYRPMRVVGGRTVSPVRGDNWCNHCHDL